MSKLIVIGEALIDCIPNTKGVELKKVEGFKRVAGGAPANVAGACAKLKEKATLLTCVANDAFGDYLIDVFKENQIDISNIKRTDDYDTSLAFVSLKEDGNRDFKFYRKTAADLQFDKDDIRDDICEIGDIIHFGSVDLVESPMKEAHRELINKALIAKSIISFDPNLRFSLWDNLESLKNTVREFMQYADIIKISDEELEFITGYSDINEALDYIFKDRCKIFIYTKGADGASIYTKYHHSYHVDSLKVDVVDTTGAGDSFIGAFLASLLKDNIVDIENLSDDKIIKYLKIANAYAASTTTKEGALGAMLDLDEFKEFMNNINREG